MTKMTAIPENCTNIRAEIVELLNSRAAGDGFPAPASRCAEECSCTGYVHT
jgi:hypothetical protein